MNNTLEKGMRVLFLAMATASTVAVVLICAFLLGNGLPPIAKIGAGAFLLGQEWSPGDTPALYGIFPMILGSIYITICAVVLGVPLGIGTALFAAEICPRRLYPLLRQGIDLMAGIPSVVYGFFGMGFLVPRFGNSILSAGLLLGIMILPTVVKISESAIRAVPEQYFQGAVALGAGRYTALFGVVLPAAKSGLLAGVILGLGRAVGETMAVIMVAGNQARMPISLFKGVRSLTANIVLEMGYAADLHREALIATALVLFVFVLLINMAFQWINARSGQKG